MSRTYRKSSCNDYYRNLEAYEKSLMRWAWDHNEPCVEIAKEWFAFFRDGKESRTNSNKDFKKHTNTNIRRRNKTFNDKIKKDIDFWDNVQYNDKYSNKYLKWIYW